MKKGSLIFICFIVSFVLLSCSLTSIDRNDDGTVPIPSNTSEPKGEPFHPDNESAPGSRDQETDGDEVQAGGEEPIKNIIEERARDVLTAISTQDFEKLSEAIHPEKGVRFSPYSFVDGEKDLVFSSDEIKSMVSDSGIYVWGSYDGIGEPIELSFRDYFSRFVYDADFQEAEQIGYNKILGQGNTINNSFEFYENAIIVEYHFPGIDPKYEGMDWRSLRLVFEKAGDSWYLVGVIHDEWTI